MTSGLSPLAISTSWITLNRQDISKYSKQNSLKIKQIYDLIPSELNNQNKRFILKDMKGRAKFRDLEDCFVWLAEAGVALPTYTVDEPRYPLHSGDGGLIYVGTGRVAKELETTGYLSIFAAFTFPFARCHNYLALLLFSLFSYVSSQGVLLT
jgi:hypothetical protein